MSEPHASYVSSSSEDEISLNNSQFQETSSRTKNIISPVDPSVLFEIEDQAKNASRSVDKLMTFLAKELQSGTKATEDIVSVYDGAIDHVYGEVEQNIKAMYGLIAKCEELDRKMKPVTELATQVRTIKETLDLLENVCK